jgi:hypothetical protein
MSQYPPPGSQGFPPNVPPPGYGFPGQPGFGQQGYSLPAMTRTSGTAVASLVCGLIMCIPGITGLVAVITGFIGIAETGKPGVRGRGMAVAGLILGLISLCGWGLAGVGGYAMFRAAKPQRAFAKTYISDLAAGKVDQCVANSTSTLTPDILDAAAKKMNAWGTLQDTTIMAFAFNSNNGKYDGSVTGICKFPGSTHNFMMLLIKDPAGNLKADSFIWQN